MKFVSYLVFLLLIGSVVVAGDLSDGQSDGKVSSVSIPSAANAQEFTIDDKSLREGWILMDRMISAHGGKSNIDAVSSTRTIGSATLFAPEREILMSYFTFRRFPYDVRDSLVVDGSSTLRVSHPAGSWIRLKDGSVVEKCRAELVKEKRQKDRSLFNVMKLTPDSPYRPIYIGKELAGKRAIETVVIVDQGDEPLCFLEIDSENAQIISRSFSGTTVFGVGWVSDQFSDFRNIDGVRIPLKAFRSLDGKVIAEMVYDTILINPEIPTGTFEKPKSQGSE